MFTGKSHTLEDIADDLLRTSARLWHTVTPTQQYICDHPGAVTPSGDEMHDHILNMLNSSLFLLKESLQLLDKR